MSTTKKPEDLSAAELLSLAAKKLELEGKSLSDLEVGLERATRELARNSISDRLNAPESGRPKACPRCGKRCRVRAKAKPRTLKTLSGEIRYRRNYHYCENCDEGFYPRDREHDIPEHGELSFELERRILDFALNDTLSHAVERFEMHYSSESISTNQLRRVFERVSDRTESCAPEWLEEAAMAPLPQSSNPVVVQTDGSMVSTTQGWKEVKLGVIYAHEDTSGPAKAPRRTRYTAVVGALERFEDAIEQALASHAHRPSQVLWLGDGAKSIWSVANRVAPEAVEILDWYHVIEHASDCAKILFGTGSDLATQWVDSAARTLMHQGVETLLDELTACLFLAEPSPEREAIEALRRYYHDNQHRMDYRRYRAAGWPIGSGAVESAHRHVIQVRMKRAGQHWSLPVAARMAAMRALYSTTGPKRIHQAIRDALTKTQQAA